MMTERSHMDLDDNGMTLDVDNEMKSFMAKILCQMARKRSVELMEYVEARLDVLDKERSFLKGQHLEDIKALAMVATEYLGIADMFSKIAKVDGMEKTEEETNKFINRFKEIMVLIVSYGYVLARDEHEVQ